MRTSLRRVRSLPENDRNDQDRDDVRHLNHRVDGGSGSILVWVADRIAGYRRLVSGRPFSTVLAIFNQFLGIVPGPAA